MRRALGKGSASFARGVMLAPVRPAGKVAGALLRQTDRALSAMAMSTQAAGGASSASAVGGSSDGRHGGRMLKRTTHSRPLLQPKRLALLCRTPAFSKRRPLTV